MKNASCMLVLNRLFLWCILLEARNIFRNERTLSQADNSTGCSAALATTANGELFASESAVTDNVRPTVASLGFHVETNLMTGSSFNYELYALNADGYYADHQRTDNPLEELSYDYRGSLNEWTMVSSGQVAQTDLVVDGQKSQFANRPDYYEIPTEQFINTYISPNGGRKSFYLTLTTTGLVSIDNSEGAGLNAPIALINTPINSPKILVGEGAISYSFDDKPYLYATRAYLGKVLLEAQCTKSPSVSLAPSSTSTVVASHR